MRFNQLARYNIIARLMSGTVGVICALFGCGVWALVIQRLVHAGSKTLLLWFFSAWYPIMLFSWGAFKELFSFGMKVVGTNLLQFFDTRIDVFFIGTFLGMTALGYYTVAGKVLMIIWRVHQSVMRVLIPAFSRLQSNFAELRTFLCKVIKITALFNFPLFFGGMLAANEVIYLLFGPAWKPSVNIMRFMLAGGLIYTTMGYLGVILTAIGKPGLLLKIRSTITAIRLILFYVAAQYSVEWVAAANAAIAYGILLPVYLVFLCKTISLRPLLFMSQFIKPLLCIICMCATLIICKHLLSIQNYVHHAYIIISTSAIVYICSIMVLFKEECFGFIRKYISNCRAA